MSAFFKSSRARDAFTLNGIASFAKPRRVDKPYRPAADVKPLLYRVARRPRRRRNYRAALAEKRV